MHADCHDSASVRMFDRDFVGMLRNRRNLVISQIEGENRGRSSRHRLKPTKVAFVRLSDIVGTMTNGLANKDSAVR